VQGHRGELQQVILNLIRNAADAMKGITYRPRVLTVKSEAQPPNNVLISIADSGSGIDPKDIAQVTGSAIKVMTADAGYAYAKVFGGLEMRGIEALIPTKAEPIRSKVPLRRFRYDAKHDHVKCPRGKILRSNKAKIRHGRFFASKARDCAGCDLAALCLSPGRVTKAVVIVHEYPALLRARRRRERWTEQDYCLYQRHRWRSEGFHGEAKTWHGLARAVRRGLANMRIQSFLTAAAVNLKRLAAAFLALIFTIPSERLGRPSANWSTTERNSNMMADFLA
jgi:Transposase DDE domain/Histidine kinase-, DNA gyrase B-, and HSP90-like ATPase